MIILHHVLSAMNAVHFLHGTQYLHVLSLAFQQLRVENVAPPQPPLEQSKHMRRTEVVSG